jgi:type IV pilus assembly protein PilQ
MSMFNRQTWLAPILAIVSVVALVGVSGFVVGQGLNAVQSVTVSKAAAGKTIVRITTKEPLASPPPGFSTPSPARIAFDFANSGNEAGRSAQKAADGSVRKVNVIEAGGRTRVVLDLARPQVYETQVDGRTVTVTLSDQPAIAAQAQTPVVSRFAEGSPAAAAHAVRNIDFRRGDAGEGRVVVDLSDTTTGIDIRQQGKLLIVDFLQTSLPKTLERRLDVNDFGTPVSTVDAFAQAGNARLVIEPKGLWEHAAYQADNRFIIEVKPIVEDPNKLVQGSRPGYKGEKLSLNFQNVEVRSVLQVIADFTGLNIITSDSVTGNLTLRLKDIPWDQALDIILQTKGLDMRKNGSVVLIAPRQEFVLKEKQDLEQQLARGDLEPLQTETFQLNYAKASDILNLVSATKQASGDTGRTFLSKRGTAFVDPRTNILFVSDIPSRLEEVRKVIRQIDVTIRQVMIETRIVIADDRFGRQLGVRFGQQTGFRVSNRYSVGMGGSLNTVPVVSGNPPTRETRTQTPFELASGIAWAGYSDAPQLNVNLPIANAAGQLAMTLINLGSGNLINLELSALEASKRGKVIASPRVITSDNQKAEIEQGTDIPYVTPGTANNPATVAFKKAVLKLGVTPQITPDSRIIMVLEVRKDTVGQFVQVGPGYQVPSIDTKSVLTQIAVSNGDTAAIGGIYEETIRSDVDKVPFLGDIPVAGYLFKTTSKSTEKTELLIFITPRVVRDSITAATR